MHTENVLSRSTRYEKSVQANSWCRGRGRNAVCSGELPLVWVQLQNGRVAGEADSTVCIAQEAMKNAKAPASSKVARICVFVSFGFCFRVFALQSLLFGRFGAWVGPELTHSSGTCRGSKSVVAQYR